MVAVDDRACGQQDNSVDGVVFEGTTRSKSAMTGEPSRKRRRIKVTGGTINGAGAFTMRPPVLGEHMLLDVRAWWRASRSRAPIQKLADSPGRFVPMAVLVAIAAFVASGGGTPARAGLRSARRHRGADHRVPCALGLATPMSIMVGMERRERGRADPRCGSTRVPGEDRYARGGQDRHAYRRTAKPCGGRADRRWRRERGIAPGGWAGTGERTSAGLALRSFAARRSAASPPRRRPECASRPAKE